MKLGHFVPTLESLSDTGLLGATEDALKAAETGTDVAEGMAEINKNAEEIDGVQTGIEDAFKAEDKIENLLEGAEQTMQEGGMSDKEAKLLEVTTESILYSIGMGHRTSGMTQSPILSLESYAAPQTKRGATIATMEKLMDTVKKVGEQIVKALKAALDKVIGFISGLMRNRSLMEKHLNNLAGRVAAIDTSKQEKAKDKISGGAAALSVGGEASVTTAEKVIKGAIELVIASESMAAAVGTSKSAEEASKAVREAASRVKAVAGGRTLKVEDASEGVVTLAFTEGKTAKEITAPTKEEMARIIKSAQNALKELRGFEQTQTKFKDGINSLIKRLHEVKDVVRSKVGGDDAKKSEYAEAASVKKKARQAQAILAKAGGSLPAAAFQAIKGVADYVSAGIANYKAPAKKDEK